MDAAISPFVSWDKNMRGFADASLKQAESALAALQVQTSDIVAEFREQREALQLEAQAEVDARTPVGRKPRRLYAALNIFGRVRGGTLELYWQEVHRHRITHRPVYKYLRMNSDGQGDLRLILARARDFEIDLVRATELEARRVRTQWSHWAQIRRHCMRAHEMVERKEPAIQPREPLPEWLPAARIAKVVD